MQLDAMGRNQILVLTTEAMGALLSTEASKHVSKSRPRDKSTAELCLLSFSL
jgi:hypothetical protein